MRTILFTGSRGWEDASTVIDCIETMRRPFRGIVGDAKGFDTIVWEVLAHFELPRLRFKAKWKTHHRGAGHERNRLMIAYLDLVRAGGEPTTVIAGWDGESTGTKGCMDEAAKQGFDVFPLMYAPRLNGR